MSFATAGQSSGHRYSYSGSDSLAWAYWSGRADRLSLLESLHTISWSVHEAKGQARSLGFKGIKGVARGVRTLGGSLIMTVIEDNPLASLMDTLESLKGDPEVDSLGWSWDWQNVGVGSGLNTMTHNRRLASTIPPFNILIRYQAEGAQWTDLSGDTELSSGQRIIPGAATLLEGVEFLDEGMTTSTQDSATEVVYSFFARDCKTLSKQQFTQVLDNRFPLDTGLAVGNELWLALRGIPQAQAYRYKVQVNELQTPPSTRSNQLIKSNQ